MFSKHCFYSIITAIGSVAWLDSHKELGSWLLHLRPHVTPYMLNYYKS